MRSILGIYFGIKTISIVETQNKKIINSLTIPHEAVSGGELEEKVPEEIKLVALIKNELRNAGIETKDTAITIPGNDLIIRSFEMNFLPKEELLTAVNFEAKKYIPFKTEELITDFQLKPDRKTKKNLVLFFSIKKEVLEKYLSVADQLGLNIINMEYSGFSILRLLDLTGVKKRGIFGIVDVDLEEETNFTVLEEGFPLFSRDINLALGLEGQVQIAEPAETSSLPERLKNEVRISLDYFRRKFPTKQMNALKVIADQASINEIKTLGNELGLPIEFIDIAKYIGLQTKFNIGSIKAFGASLANVIKIPCRSDLLSSRRRLKAVAVKISEAEQAVVIFPIPLRVDYRFVLASLVIIFLSFILGLYQRLPLEKQVKDIISNRLKLASLAGPEAYTDLQAIYSRDNEKLNMLDNTLKQQAYLTEVLNVIPAVLPDGVWLTEFSFKQEGAAGAELILTGRAFLGDRNKEFEVINRIPPSLRDNPTFNKTFKAIEIVSLERTKIQDWEVTNFIIACRAKRYGT